MITTWNLRHIKKPEMLDILRHVPGLTLVEQEPFVSGEYELDGFETEYPQMTKHVRRELEQAVRMCETFLKGIVVTDSFKDHFERRHWRHSMAHHFGSSFVELWGSNKLRLNNLGGVHLALDVTSESMAIFRVSSERSEKIKALKIPNLTEYEDTLPIQKKLECVARFDVACRFFLDILTKK